MATYAELTQEQKDQLAALERNTRGWLNSLAALLAQARALDAAWSASGGGDGPLIRRLLSIVLLVSFVFATG